MAPVLPSTKEGEIGLTITHSAPVTVQVLAPLAITQEVSRLRTPPVAKQETADPPLEPAHDQFQAPSTDD